MMGHNFRTTYRLGECDSHDQSMWKFARKLTLDDVNDYPEFSILEEFG